MKRILKRVLIICKRFYDEIKAPVEDILFLPLVYLTAPLLRRIRSKGTSRFPCCRNALLSAGVFPVLDHYGEPRFNYRDTKRGFDQDRHLPGIDWNISGQLEFLKRLTFSDELVAILQKSPQPGEFNFNQDFFRQGDAEYWYQVIRAVKPRRIIEIGSGHSTLMAINAIRQNSVDDPEYRCEHICIDPFRTRRIRKTGVSLINKRVEDMSLSLFRTLQENDILFVDSSHIIRPQGDVLFEYLEILPSLDKGVIMHVHDIFSPKDYLEVWLKEDIRFWNEQYLLEAFLSHNDSWEIVGAINWLFHNHYERLGSVAPFLTPDTTPGSFYIRKIA